MKKNIFILLLSACFFMSFTIFTHQDHVKINTESSTVKWIGSKITESHEGTIKIQSGELILDHGKLVGGDILIDMTSIENTDQEGKGKQKLEGHLKSDDFFDVKRHPLSTITITKATKTVGNNYSIVADLTIKGITHSITFDADVRIKGISFLATANIKIDRTKWDITYNSGTFGYIGDYLILDDIVFDIFLLSVK